MQLMRQGDQEKSCRNGSRRSRSTSGSWARTARTDRRSTRRRDIDNEEALQFDNYALETQHERHYREGLAAQSVRYDDGRVARDAAEHERNIELSRDGAGASTSPEVAAVRAHVRPAVRAGPGLPREPVAPGARGRPDHAAALARHARSSRRARVSSTRTLSVATCRWPAALARRRAHREREWGEAAPDAARAAHAERRPSSVAPGYAPPRSTRCPSHERRRGRAARGPRPRRVPSNTPHGRATRSRAAVAAASRDVNAAPVAAAPDAPDVAVLEGGDLVAADTATDGAAAEADAAAPPRLAAWRPALAPRAARSRSACSARS